MNILPRDVQIALRKRKYDFSKSESVIKHFDKIKAKMKLNGANESDKLLGPVDNSDIIPLKSNEKKKVSFNLFIKFYFVISKIEVNISRFAIFKNL